MSNANPAVLLLIFNRPRFTREVMDRLESIKPSRLYVAADGPRLGREGEEVRCEEARRIATSVNWECTIRTLFRGSNLGCKRAVSGALDWFFDHEDEGIILEDDCVPHLDFFRFCRHGLNLYRGDDRVYAITGDNFQDGAIRGGGSSYYFSKYPHCWGWATWRRAWKAYDSTLSFWDDWVQTPRWQLLHAGKNERLHWERLAKQVKNGSLDSWATPWMFSVWFHEGLTMTPNVNLVANIGFGPDATHTFSKRDGAASLPVSALGFIQDPSDVLLDKTADQYVFHFHFGGRNLKFPRTWIIRLIRVLAILGRVFSSYPK